MLGVVERPDCSGANAMREMVERVAKAMAESGRIDDGERASETTDDGWERLARAAIAAMREPTPAMIEAAIKTWDQYAAGHRLLGSDVEDIWQAMIDKALE